MRNISSIFKEAIRNDNRRYEINATITLLNGTVLEIQNNDIWDNGFKVEDSVSGGTNFQIGSAIINKVTLVLNNLYEKFSEYDFFGAKLILKVTLPSEIVLLSYKEKILTYKEKILTNDKKYDIIHMGTYTVDEPQYNGSLITLECLDNMNKFDRSYIESSLKYPASLFDIVYDCCSVCGVQLITTTFGNSHVVVKEKPLEENITFREVLQWVSQMACSWAKCDEYGRLELKWCNQEVLESENPDGKLYHTIDAISSITTSTDDVVITGIKSVFDTKNEKGENIQEEIIKGETGYILSFEGNPFIQKDNVVEVTNYLSNKLIGLRFRPFNLSHLDDPSIQAGDIIKIISFGKTYWSIITSTTFQPGNYQTSACNAETPSRNSSTMYNESTKAYVEMRKLINEEKTERQVAIENLNKVLSESAGLYPTEEVQPDGSTIYYLHDKPKIEDSKTIIKLTAEAIGVSTDGGKTYPYGFTVTGDMITRILYTTGVDADWIRTGNIIARDKDGNIKFSVNIDTGETIIDANRISIGNKDVQEIINDKTSQLEIGGVNLLKNSKNLVDSSYLFSANKPA